MAGLAGAGRASQPACPPAYPASYGTNIHGTFIHSRKQHRLPLHQVIHDTPVANTLDYIYIYSTATNTARDPDPITVVRRVAGCLL